jgi:hypothetical protein
MTPHEYAARLRWSAMGELIAALSLIGGGAILIALASTL